MLPFISSFNIEKLALDRIFTYFSIKGKLKLKMQKKSYLTIIV